LRVEYPAFVDVGKNNFLLLGFFLLFNYALFGIVLARVQAQ
jgi:hypothetical protein